MIQPQGYRNPSSKISKHARDWYTLTFANSQTYTREADCQLTNCNKNWNISLSGKYGSAYPGHLFPVGLIPYRPDSTRNHHLVRAFWKSKKWKQEKLVVLVKGLTDIAWGPLKHQKERFTKGTDSMLNLAKPRWCLQKHYTLSLSNSPFFLFSWLTRPFLFNINFQKHCGTIK